MHTGGIRRKRGDGVEEVKVGNAVVTVYHDRHSSGRPRWRVADKTTGVRRLRQFFARTAAIAEARRIAQAISNGQAVAAQMTNSEAASYGRAVELLQPTGLSLELAASIVADAVAVLGGNHIRAAAEYFAARRPDKLIPKAVPEAVAEYRAAREAAKASSEYLADLRWRLKAFAEDFQCPIASVTTSDIQAWLDGRKMAPRNALNFRRALSGLFTFAETRGYIIKGSNPVDGTDKVRIKGHGAIPIYTPEEGAALLAAMPAEALPAVAVMAFAGVRVAEALRLDWGEIDLKGGWIKLSAEKAKTRSRRLVPVLPALVAWLKPIAKEKGPLWDKSSDYFSERMRQASEAADVPIKPNAWRHTWISCRVATTGDVNRTALEAGNSAAVVFSNYREMLKPEEGEAWFAVCPPQATPAMGKSPPTTP